MKIMAVLLLFFSLTLFADNKELKEGDKAPDFTLEDYEGNSYTLSDFQGKSAVVIYFYPKANTAGCTKQACGIRDDWSRFEKNNIKVFGISTDTKEEIEKFVKDYSLNFPLLSDASKEVSKEYNVLRESGVAGRVTFIVDKDGKIAKVIEVNDIDSHSNQVFETAKNL